MMRMILSFLAGCFALFALYISFTEPGAWPILCVAALFVAGTIFEQVRYRGEKSWRTGGRWRVTPEIFRDDISGVLVTVWFNEATGERRYVPDGEAPPA